MAKLNAPKRPFQLANHPDATTNYEGGLAFTASPELELATRVASCLWKEPAFYGEQEEAEAAILALLHKVDPEFVVRLATYAREMLHLRTVPQVLLVHAANRQPCEPKPYIRDYGQRIVRRADEVMDVLAYQIDTFGRPIPMALRRVLCDRLNLVSAYEATKYRRAGAGMSMTDALNLLHPKPVDAYRAEIFRWLIDGEFDAVVAPDLAARQALLALDEWGPEAVRLAEWCDATWEDLISKFGNRKEVWEAATLPYMALLRNLRNMVEAGVDMHPYAEVIADPSHVVNSRQLPFRFWSAYRQLCPPTTPRYDYYSEEPQPKVTVPQYLLDALIDALEASADNLPRLPGTTLIVTDYSGSMDNPISERSSVRLYEIGFVLSALAHRACDEAIVSVFADRFQTVPMSTRDSVMTNIERLRATDVGGSTFAHLAFDWLTETRTKVDRIILLSDMQCYSPWNSISWYDSGGSVSDSLRAYRNQVNPNARLVSIDLKGYGTLQTPEEDPLTLIGAGWSERVLELIPMWEEGFKTMLDTITRM